MNGRILAKNRLHVVSAAQRLPSVLLFKTMSASTLENDLMPVSCAMQDFINRLASYTTSVLIMVKGLLSVVYAAAGLRIVATVTNIKNAVGARGSRFMKNA